jgi:hypothetical protein
MAKGPVNLLMRLYWPKIELLDGWWTPVLVKPNTDAEFSFLEGEHYER